MATATQPELKTLADRHAKLGGVPMERIRLHPAPGTATEADIEPIGKSLCELIDGVLVEKARGALESFLGAHIARFIGNHVAANGLGVVTGADGFIRLGPGLVRAPDVTFVPWSELPADEVPQDEAFWTVAPGLIVEVLRPGNTKAEIDRKLTELFKAGCKLAWAIDPRARTAKVYTTAKKFKELDETGTLDGGKVLPGFTLSLADLFASTKRTKKKP